MLLVDSHCHLDFEAFDSDREAVLDRAAAAGVGAIVVPGVKRGTWGRLAGLCRDRDGLHYALGLHPLFIGEHGAAALKALSDRTAALSPVAVGEIGLDFHDRATACGPLNGAISVAGYIR